MAVRFVVGDHIVCDIRDHVLIVDQGSHTKGMYADNSAVAADLIRRGNPARMRADVGELRKLQSFLFASGHIKR